MNLIQIFRAVLGEHDTKSSAQKHESGKSTDSSSRGKFWLAKLRLASHPGTSPRSLHKLTQKESSEKVLERVAENPSASRKTLKELAGHEHPEVRSAVTDNENTPAETLQSLASDESVDVRYRLAENPRTPIETLYALANDENPYVADRAKQTLKNFDAEP